MTMSKLFTHFFASFKIYPFVLCWWLVGSVGCGGRTHSNFVLFISSSNLLLSIPIAHISDVDCPRLNTALALSFKSSFWMGQPRPLLHLFSVFSIKHCNFTANYCYKNVPPMLGFDSRPSVYDTPTIFKYFQVRYDSRVVIYDRRAFIRLTTGLIPTSLLCRCAYWCTVCAVPSQSSFFSAQRSEHQPVWQKIARGGR